MIKKTIEKALFIPLTILNKLIPKKKDKVFFYSNMGFRDNTRAMFEYFIETKKNDTMEIVCSLDDYNKYQSLQKTNEYNNKWKNVKFVSNKAGIIHFLRCQYGFYSFGKYPIKPSKHQVIINLWHGMPLKRIGNMEEHLKNVDYNYFSYIIATSEFFKEIMKKCFNASDNQVFICGEPRNDEMLKSNKSFQMVPDMRNDDEIKKEFNKIFVWFPTYRNHESTNNKELDRWPVPLISPKEAEQLNILLKNSGSKLIIKLHPLQYFIDDNMIFSNIEIINQNKMEKEYGTVYRLLRLSDALITDYSSVYFDYLLLNRPMAFTVDDMDKYKGDRGFVFDNPLDYMPGDKIKTYADLEKFVYDIENGNDNFVVQRKKINTLVNLDNSNESCKKIFEFANDKLKNNL